MYDTLVSMFSYDFMQRALIVGLMISLCSALLGVSLVLRRYAMIGDGLSHVGFGAMALACAMHMAPLWVAIPIVMLSAFWLLRLSDASRIRGDSAIALIAASALAIGVITVSVTDGMNVDLHNYMFGSILALTRGETVLTIVLSALMLALYVFFYHRIFAITFDEEFSRATGLPTQVFHVLVALLTSVSVVLGMRMMGTLLISSLLIFPALSAMRVTKDFRSTVIVSAILSVVCFTLGLVVSYVWETPTGATVVVMHLMSFLVMSLAGRLRR